MVRFETGEGPHARVDPIEKARDSEQRHDRSVPGVVQRLPALLVIRTAQQARSDAEAQRGRVVAERAAGKDSDPVAAEQIAGRLDVRGVERGVSRYREVEVKRGLRGPA